MGIPFAPLNRLALDASVASSVTTSIDGVTQWSDLGPTGNVFTNDHAAGSQPGYSGGLITFDGGDHLHRAGGLIPATSDFALTARVTPGSVSGSPVILAQYTPGASGWVILRIHLGGWRLSGVPPGNDLLFGGTPTVGVPTTLTARRIGNVWVLRVNGTQVATTTSSVSVLQVGNIIGSRSSQSGNYDGPQVDHWTGSIERIGVWHGAFDNDDLEAVEDWAANGTSLGGIPQPLLEGWI